MKHLLVIVLFGLGALFATARAEAVETEVEDVSRDIIKGKNLLR